MHPIHALRSFASDQHHVSWALAGRYAWYNVVDNARPNLAGLKALLEEDPSQADWMDTPCQWQASAWMAAAILQGVPRNEEPASALLSGIVDRVLTTADGEAERRHRVGQLLGTSLANVWRLQQSWSGAGSSGMRHWAWVGVEALRSMFADDPREIPEITWCRQALSAHARAGTELASWMAAIQVERARAWLALVAPDPCPLPGTSWAPPELKKIQAIPLAWQSRSLDLSPELLDVLEEGIVRIVEAHAHPARPLLLPEQVALAGSWMARALVQHPSPPSPAFVSWFVEQPAEALVLLDSAAPARAELRARCMQAWMETSQASAVVAPRPRF